MEYSEKDDKFRVLIRSCRNGPMLRLDGIESVTIIGDAFADNTREVLESTEHITLELLDHRNALERVMLHFAHFEKQAEKLNRNTYLVKIKYSHDDETEMVIRILSFGPLVEVIESENFRKLVIEKLKKQKNCGLK